MQTTNDQQQKSDSSDHQHKSNTNEQQQTSDTNGQQQKLDTNEQRQKSDTSEQQQKSYGNRLFNFQFIFPLAENILHVCAIFPKDLSRPYPRPWTLLEA